MVNRDLIRFALSQPINWLQFERMACDVLMQDDYPSLTKLGGVADEGADAIQESFFERRKESLTVIQITSAKAQSYKVRQTITRLNNAGIHPDELVVVFQGPVASAVRTKVQRDTRMAAPSMSIDLRDEDYLITQLSKRGSTVFSRYFESIQDQLAKLLNKGDPLKDTDDKLSVAILASLTAFVLDPTSRIVRNSLFDRTILAILASAGVPISVADICNTLRHDIKLGLGIGEADLEPRVRGAVQRLTSSGHCVTNGDRVGLAIAEAEHIGASLTRVQETYDSLVAFVVSSVEEHCLLDDRSKGRLERNLRRAMVYILRQAGPSIDIAADASDIVDHRAGDLVGILGDDLDRAAARAALSALAVFIDDSANGADLATFARAYSAVFIYNLDPLGQSWQASLLTRSSLVLDSDAVLFALIDDVPECKPVRTAIQKLAQAGISILIPEPVLEECLNHIARSDRTYRRVSESIRSLPPAGADSAIWHVLVRGYYYHLHGRGRSTFADYKRRYYDELRPHDYLTARIKKLFRFQLLKTDDLPELPAEEDLAPATQRILLHKERRRPKAQFRDDSMMLHRIEDDLRIALFLAEPSDQGVESQSRGYLVTSDSAFGVLQRDPVWKSRPFIVVPTRNIPFLAEALTGERMENDDLVRLVFNPVITAAAESVASSIDVLARAHVNLKNQDLVRLEWDLRGSLRDAIDRANTMWSSTASSSDDRALARLDVADAADRAGYAIDEDLRELLEQNRRLREEIRRGREIGLGSDERAAEVIRRLMGKSKKGRRRIERLLKEIDDERRPK